MCILYVYMHTLYYIIYIYIYTYKHPTIHWVCLSCSFTTQALDGLPRTAGVEFRNRLQTEFDGVNLPNSMVFDYPTVTAARREERTGRDGLRWLRAWRNTGHAVCNLCSLSIGNGQNSTFARCIYKSCFSCLFLWAIYGHL